jgi:AraC-like DNA-binding protein
MPELCVGPSAGTRLGCAVVLSSRANLADGAAAAELPGAYAYELVTCCARKGVAAEDLLAGTGLTLEALKDPATRLPLPACADLVERARTLAKDPALALTMGLHMRFSWHGFLGFAAMTAPTVRDALAIAEQFSLTRTSAVSLATHVEGAIASLVLEDRVPSGALREFLVLALLVGIARIAFDATGTVVRGVAELAFPEPPYLRDALGSLPAGTMRFDQPSHRLVFDASVLELRILQADPAAMQLARSQCDRELAALAEGEGFAGRVRREIAAREEQAPASLEAVARALGASTRTLKRRLAEQSTSFTELTDAVRRQRALLLLDDRRLTVTDVADRLGYSDVANFTRAFRRWTGRTPAAFRAR